jgi:hypothetical protein
MKTEVLQRKLERYIHGTSMPSETRQIQTWLSCTATKNELIASEKEQLQEEILSEVQAYTAYPLFYPKKDNHWWQKFTAFF